MCNVKLRCDTCGQFYKECDNVGAWECQDAYVWSDALGKKVKIPADHGGPWYPLSTTNPPVAEIPSYAMHHLTNVRPEAVLANPTTAQTRQPGRSAVTVYENVRIARLNLDLYHQTQRKFWFVPAAYAGRTDLGFAPASWS